MADMASLRGKDRLGDGEGHEQARAPAKPERRTRARGFVIATNDPSTPYMPSGVYSHNRTHLIYPCNTRDRGTRVVQHSSNGSSCHLEHAFYVESNNLRLQPGCVNSNSSVVLSEQPYVTRAEHPVVFEGRDMHVTIL